MYWLLGIFGYYAITCVLIYLVTRYATENNYHI